MDFEADAVKVDAIYSYDDVISYEDECEGVCPACGSDEMSYFHYSSAQNFVFPEDCSNSWVCNACSSMFVPKFYFDNPVPDNETLAPPLNDRKINSIIHWLSTGEDVGNDEANHLSHEDRIEAKTKAGIVLDWLPDLMTSQQWGQYQILKNMRESGLVDATAYYDQLHTILEGGVLPEGFLPVNL